MKQHAKSSARTPAGIALGRKTLICIPWLLAATLAGAGDWPTYRHDNSRTGCSSERLETPLALRWVYQSLNPPDPAWPDPATRPREGFLLRNRVVFDDAFQVSCGNGLVFFGSSADGKVYALDAATGEIRWSCFTEGPVRLAPTLWKDRVLFGSDDGFAYCLNASDGKLIWKQRGGGNAEKLLGHGRMISRWPVRTGVLVEAGVAYFGAGIFPHEKVYLSAVRVEDGKVLWRNDTISQENAQRNELSPQGYLLASRDRLFVPSGRGLPAAFEVANGELLFDRQYGWRGEAAGGVVGGTYAVLADGQMYTGTQEHLLALDQKDGSTGFGWLPGRRLAVAGDMAYLATGSEIMAINRTAFASASQRRNALEFKIRGLESSRRTAKDAKKRAKLDEDLRAARRELSRHREERIAPTIQWRNASHDDAELIACRNLVIAGGNDVVVALDVADGTTNWSAQVEGQARGLAVADGRLYVSTDKGYVYGFAAGRKPPARTIASRPTQSPYPSDELSPVYAEAAETILWSTGVRKGYALVLGAEQGRLAWELARQTDLYIVGIEPDAAKARMAREALDRAGLYGTRIVIEHGGLEELPYPNYFANLIVSDTMLLTGRVPVEPERVKRHLKPWGGVVVLGSPAKVPRQAQPVTLEQLSQWLARLDLGPCRTLRQGGNWATLARGPLPGAGKWTHQYAEPGNTACSDEKLLGGALGLLWFGRPGSAPMVNRHNAAAAPLAVNGRLFIQGEEIVMAYDAYNGLEQWQRRLPGAMRTRLKARECGNLAASDDSLFVALDDHCVRLEAETGRTRATYRLPAASTDESKWGYLAHADGILVGSSSKALGVSDALFALDPDSGKVLWHHQGSNIVNLTIAIGDGWVFFIDSSMTPSQRQALLQGDKTSLRRLGRSDAEAVEQDLKKADLRLATALDARTGGKLWSQPVDVTDCSKIGIGGGELTAMYHDGVLLLCGANANGHYWKQFLAGEFSVRRLVALAANDGEVLWARDADYRHRPVIIGDRVLAEPWVYDLRTGRQSTRTHPITGRATPWQFLRPGHHCGAISACPQMLLMRSGSTSYYDLRDDDGISHFAGHRLGCWINAIPANGLALIPEASAGCVCLHPINCTLVLEPRPDRQNWTIYSAGGPTTPVQKLAVNFGAPGDRRDEDGTIWFGYPRPSLPQDRAAMGLSLDLKAELLPGGTYDFFNSEAVAIAGTDKPWLFTSWVRGVQRCVVPLLGEDDSPRSYTVRLYFTEPDESAARPAAFRVKIQNQEAVGSLNVAQRAGGCRKALMLEFPGITVEQNLEVELVPCEPEQPADQPATILCGMEVIWEASTEEASARPSPRPFPGPWASAKR